MAHAAKTVGIEQDKLGDIFKDVNDKMGDFAVTGAGPLADFFDTIGKKVGVTIEDFKGLSGPEALGLFSKSLEDAGASAQETTFFMESLAGDATALTPLLKNNSESFKTLGAEMQNVISAQQVAQAAEMTRQFDTLASNINNKLQSAFINAAVAAADFFALTEGVVEADLKLVNKDIEGWEKAIKELKDGELTALSIEMAELGIEVDTNWFRDDNIADVDALMTALQNKLVGSQESARGLKGELLDMATAPIPPIKQLVKALAQ